MWSLILAASFAATETPSEKIPYSRFVLDNGLTVIVHEDRKAPIVAVNLWYHVGSKDEPRGRSGFAHLFEHLMFQGSEHYNDEYFKPFERVGATNMNGTTNFDRTNYFQNVPASALDLALWMESDRMGHLLGVIDQDRLDEQRGVVQNEKRQGENQPYGRVWETLLAAVFPADHPYSWTPIGSMADLEAASLEDVKDWFRSYYGAANATLVLAGDIDAATAREKVERYFGHIRPGRLPTRHQRYIAQRVEATRQVQYDRVPNPRLYRVYNVPEFGSADALALNAYAALLGQGRTSRLYRKLVDELGLATEVVAFNESLEIAGLFMIQVDLKKLEDLPRVEELIAAEIEALNRKGPGASELARELTAIEASAVRALERIGGFGGKADVLAECAVYSGDPGCFEQQLAQTLALTPTQVAEVGRRWLSRGEHTLLVRPERGPTMAKESAIDRKAGPPVIESFPDLAFPTIERSRLGNGIELVYARREGLPLTQIEVLFAGGYAADQDLPAGTASIVADMLTRGAGKLDAQQIIERADELGVILGADASIDDFAVRINTLSKRLDDAVELLALVLTAPTFDAAELDKLKTRRIAAIGREKAQPQTLAFRLLPPLLYGAGHPYAAPLTGTGSEQSVAQITPQTLNRYRERWLRPDNATIIAVGNLPAAAVREALERELSRWSAPASARPEIAIDAVPDSGQTKVYLVDRPDSTQSVIFAGRLVASPADPADAPWVAMNTILGGSFTSRLNMNLREDKSWSYGVSAVRIGTRGHSPWVVVAPVQTDRTADSIREIQRELSAYGSDQPATADELAKVTERAVRGLPGSYETLAAVLGTLRSNWLYGRPDDYALAAKARLEGVTLDQVHDQARQVLAGPMVWVIVGDREKIEAGVSEVLGPAQPLDVDGQPPSSD